jgi:hypothetical protein
MFSLKAPTARNIGMNLPFYCPYCDELLEIAPGWAGKPLLCPRCEGRVAAPVPSSRARPQLSPSECLLIPYNLATWGGIGYFFVLLLAFALGLLVGYYT